MFVRMAIGMHTLRLMWMLQIVISLKNNGIISIDFNYGFLAISDLDRYGNVVNSFQVPYKSTHCTSEQTQQSLSEALKIVIQYAVDQAKPIGCEKLDFKKKKTKSKADVLETSKNVKWFCLLNLSIYVTEQMRNGWY